MKRGSYTTPAIVLGSVDYGESDRIVSFYTLEYGKLSAIAKGARRSKKRFVGKLEPCVVLNLDFFYPGPYATIMRAESAVLIDAHASFRRDPALFGAACYMAEFTSAMTPEWQRNEAYFHMLEEFLGALENARAAELLLRFFDLKALTILGYLPYLDGCVSCKRPFNGEAMSFSPDRGGALCFGCGRGVLDLTPLSPGTAGFLSMASKLETEKLGRLVPNPLFLDECGRAFCNFIRRHAAWELKSASFLEKIRISGIMSGGNAARQSAR